MRTKLRERLPRRADRGTLRSGKRFCFSAAIVPSADSDGRCEQDREACDLRRHGQGAPDDIATGSLTPNELLPKSPWITPSRRRARTAQARNSRSICWRRRSTWTSVAFSPASMVARPWRDLVGGRRSRRR